MLSTNKVINSSSFFNYGKTEIVNGNLCKSEIYFAALKLRQGEIYNLTSELETAALLMSGQVTFSYGQEQYTGFRVSYFDEDPIVLHISKNEYASVQALTDCEIMLIQTENNKQFLPVIFDKNNMLMSENRGNGLLQNSSQRIVRTVFDKRNRCDSNLVLGEIVTPSGHWSSYPPHFHTQPEIYFYRFSEPQGFAFGENGEHVLRIKHNESYVILNGESHAHCVAPGYAMYTLWCIRHMPNNNYIEPTFLNEHEWTRSMNANVRVWKHLDALL